MLPKIAAAAVSATLAGALAGCSPQAEPDREATPAATQAAPQPPARDSTGIMLFLGTSLTAGYGIGAEHAYPARIQQKIDSVGYPLRVVNAGISGETSAGGLRRIDWSLQQPVRILVLELGANDGLRGLSVDAMRDNLTEIIDRTLERYPGAEIVIAGMEAPPNLGERYTREFRQTFRDLARKYDATLIPFLLENVAMVPELNQEDRIHPNMEGQRRIAETVWPVLEPVIQRAVQPSAKAATE